jgi:aspartate kinase
MSLENSLESNPMHVMKFGPVSVSDPARLRDVVTMVKAEAPDPVVVICTALEGMTNTLIGAARAAVSGNETAIEAARRELWGRHRALAERLVSDEWEREALYREWAELLKTFDRVTRALATLGEPSPRGIDAVAALGERFIGHLFGVVLREGGVAARVIDAADLIVTDDRFGAARPLEAESIERIRLRLRPLLVSGIAPVITGYIGATRDRVVTTLGRGGGDYTAALVGAAMGVEEVCLWSDVDGILTADPKIVPDARTLGELSYHEASQITTFGAEVLHPRTLAPLRNTSITLRIRSVFHLGRSGTRIVARPQPTSRPARTIISTPNLALLRISVAQGERWSPEVPARALARLTDAGIEILTSAPSLNERSLLLTVRSSDAEFARVTLTTPLHPHATQSDHSIFQVEHAGTVALVTVISASGSTELTPLTLAALGRAGVHLLALTCDPEAAHITLVLPEAELHRAVRTLHDDLRLAS